MLGASSALLGIAHAAVQNRLSRVIAYSSIENTGLIVVGFGVALTGAGIGDRRLVAAGLLAATLQVVTHTLAKSLLFTSSARIEAATGADDLEELRGRARRTPWSGFGLAVGSLTLAGLPPTAGFVSEWFLLESLMQQFRVPGLGYRRVLDPVAVLVVGGDAADAAADRAVRLGRVRAAVAAGPPGPGLEVGDGRRGGADSYTAFGYANPTRRVLASVLHTQAELHEVMMEENGRDDGAGPPDPRIPAGKRRPRTCGTPPTSWR